MQLTSEATNQDLTSEIDLLCDSDSTSYALEDKVRRINYALEELVGKIINADGVWQWDDTNHTTQPEGKGTLVEGQERYSFASEYLDVREVSVLDTNDQWRRLKQLDPEDLNGMTPTEYFGGTETTANTGMPQYYDIVGDTVRLYPAPTSSSVTLASGLLIQFHRTVDLFTTSDTTQEPGIPSPYHVLLAYMASIPYCMSYKKDRVALYQRKVEEMTDNLIKHYSNRNKDRRKIMTPKRINYI